MGLGVSINGGRYASASVSLGKFGGAYPRDRLHRTRPGCRHDDQARPDAAAVAARHAAATQRAKAEYDQLVADLTGTDPAAHDAALKTVERKAVNHWANRYGELRILADLKLYSDLETVALRVMVETSDVQSVQRLRMQALIDQEQWPEALSAAKTYYDCCALNKTSDAINFVALCLANARKDDPGIALRFKHQQAAWATTDAPATASSDLGEPVLATIPGQPTPLDQAIAAVKLTNWLGFTLKGNLLLVAGRAKEARAVFEQGQALADDSKMSRSIEDVARAIRAESGCVGPANAYILKMRSEQQQ